ncbi:hypothetical protein C8R47DRAFT_1076844 [Mycena vitilis]|nr:hypothetical protein C8R47DRAFT_1076844 [Mycena vitilis]
MEVPVQRINPDPQYCTLAFSTSKFNGRLYAHPDGGGRSNWGGRRFCPQHKFAQKCGICLVSRITRCSCLWRERDDLRRNASGGTQKRRRVDSEQARARMFVSDLPWEALQGSQSSMHKPAASAEQRHRVLDSELRCVGARTLSLVNSERRRNAKTTNVPAPWSLALRPTGCAQRTWILTKKRLMRLKYRLQPSPSEGTASAYAGYASPYRCTRKLGVRPDEDVDAKLTLAVKSRRLVLLGLVAGS